MISRFIAICSLAFFALVGSTVQVVAQVSVSLPSVDATVSTTGSIPITVGDLTGEGVTSYQFTVTYDASVLNITGVAINSTLSAGTNATVNASQAGRIIVAWAAATPLNGAGTLINLEASYLATGTSSLTFSDFVFNEGAPTSATSNGSVTVSQGGNNGPLSLSVPGSSTLTLGGGDVLIPVTVGNTNGFDVTSFAFTLSYDASRLTLIGAEGAGTKTSQGNLSSSDGGGGTLSVTWSGTALSGSGTLVNIRARPVAAGNSSLNFADASFNSGSPAAATTNGSVTVDGSTASPISVSIPDNIQGFIGDLVNVPINVDNVSGKDVTAYSFTLTYNASLLLPTSAPNNNTLSSNTAATGVISAPGRYTVTWSDNTALSGSGTLIKVQFELLREGSTPVGFQEIQFNEGTPGANTVPGNVTIEAPQSADPVNVSLANRTGPLGQTVIVPMSVDDLTGKGITQFQTTLSFNPEIIDVLTVRDAGTLLQGDPATIDLSTTGKVTLDWEGGTLSGAGTLVYLEIGLVGEGSTSLSFDAFTFNEGTPEARTASASISVSPSNNGSTVGISLPGATTGTAGETITIALNAGNVSGLGVNEYTFILDYDASVLSFTGASKENTLSSSGSLNVNASTPGVLTVTWSAAADLSGSGILLNLTANLLQEGSSALTFREFTFNDGEPGAAANNGSVTVLANGANSPIVVSLPAGLTGEVGGRLVVPVSTGNLTGKGVNAFSFTLLFNERDLSFASVELQGTLTAGRNVTLTNSGSGEITVSLSSGDNLSGSGTLVKLVADIIGPGTSDLEFDQFAFNDGQVGSATVDGSVSISGVATYLQLVHNSPDAPLIDIYLNDEQVTGSLQYSNATQFFEITTPLVKIDVVFDGAPDNSSPVLSETVTLVSSQSYVAVLNGLFNDSGKNNLVMVVEPTLQEADNEDVIDIVFFNGAPDASALTVNTVEENNIRNRLDEVVSGLEYGVALSKKNLVPEIYHFELVDAAGSTLAVFKADLSRASGSALLFMVQGFVEPGLGQPLLSVTAYAPDGTALFLPLVTSDEEEALLGEAFNLHGNYPEPFAPTTTITFDLREAATISLEVYDMLGRQVLHQASRTFASGRNHAIQLDASTLASGIYIYRLRVQGRAQEFVVSDTMTLRR